MKNKYCKKINEVAVPWKDGSHVWMNMIEMRDLIEHQISWQTKRGNAFFCYDNWTGLWVLYQALGLDHWYDETITRVSDVVEDGNWNEGLLRDILSEELVEHILECITPPQCHDMEEKPGWKLESRGQFSMKSGW